jgi:hypothetical protein
MADGLRNGLLGSASPSSISAFEAARNLSVTAEAAEPEKNNTIRNLVRPEPSWEETQAAEEQEQAQALVEKTEGDAQESAEEADAAPPEEEPSGEDEGEETAPESEDQEPAIDAPQSWTKEEKAAFKALPHAHQQAIAERERARELEIRRGQNEVAQARKSFETQAQAAEQVRQQYESALPQLQQQVQWQANAAAQQLQSEFPDIKTWADAAKMQQDDPMKYQKWDLLLKQHHAFERQEQLLLAEANRVATERQQEAVQNFQGFAKAETEKFLQAAPEYADPKTSAQWQADTARYLAELEVTPSEVQALWSGQSNFSLRDHRVQLIIRDAVRYRKAQIEAKAPKRVVKPVPSVQKPGVSRTTGERSSERMKTLETKLDRSHSRQDAVNVLLARMKSG